MAIVFHRFLSASEPGAWRVRWRPGQEASLAPRVRT